MGIDFNDIESVRARLRRRGICVVIPTYNNAGTIADVVMGTLEYCGDVIVVCDGCTDGTVEIVKGIEGATVVVMEKTGGKGNALKAGFDKALSMGFAYAITLDGDGQHYPSDIPIFLRENIKHPGALIVGERQMENAKRSAGSVFANKFSNFWFALQTFTPLRDTQTGYRLYPLKKLSGLGMLTSRYEAELELMVFAKWGGVELCATPVNVYYPPAEERVSHFRPGKDFARISVLNTVLCVGMLVYGWPRMLLRWLWKVARTALYWFTFLLMCIMATVIVLFKVCIGKRTEEKNEFLHRLIWSSARFCVIHLGIPGAKFKMTDEAKEDLGKPHIIMCNHQSSLDLFCLLTLTPKLIFLTNERIWNNPVYGMIIRNAEYINVSDGIDASMPHLRSLIDRGYSIAVFPEGTRSVDGQLLKFRQGAAYMARNLNVNMLATVIYGANRALPKGAILQQDSQIHLNIDKMIPWQEIDEKGGDKKFTAGLYGWYVERYAEICDKMDRDA